MFEKLRNMLQDTYSPYSNFPVSAIVVTKENKEYKGVNIENATYGATICAERNAINSAISNGIKKYDFKELHVLVNTDKISSPCFLCRQSMEELFDKDTKIIVYNRTGDNKVYSLEELCPYPFNEDDLK